MSETLLPRTPYEVQLAIDTRTEVLDELCPITPEQVAAAEEEIVARITLRLQNHRTEEWVEPVDEAVLDEEFYNSPTARRQRLLSLSALDGTMDQMARAGAFETVETEGSGENPTLFYEIRAEDSEGLEAD